MALEQMEGFELAGRTVSTTIKQRSTLSDTVFAAPSKHSS